MAQIQSSGRPAYRSPIDVAYSPDGSLLAVADRTLPGLSLIKTSDGSVKDVPLSGYPYHVRWNGNSKVLVAEGNNGTVAEVDVTVALAESDTSKSVLRRLNVGLVAKGLALTPDGSRLLTCDRAANKLVVFKMPSGEVDFSVEVGREPSSVTVDKDGKYAVVGNKLPKPADPLHGMPAAELSIVDLSSKKVTALPLVKQATMVRQVVLSPDGKWAYVTHQSPRGGLPVTQLDNGWVMTNAMSVIDMNARSLYASFIFDKSGSGGAHPWGAAINKDGSKLWVALQGVREVATVDLTALHKKLAGYSEAQRAKLLTDLSDLHASNIIKRTVLTGIDGPRGVALSPDGNTLAVAAYFSGKVLLLSPTTLAVTKTITLPGNPDKEDVVRTGERYYYSAMYCYQTWLSCSSCHDEGRPDGLNWDLQNDGTGNPKQTKAHVYSHETPPTNVSGCRENSEVSSRAGYQYIEFQAAPEERVQATYEFMKSLIPEPSPFLGTDGQLTPEAVEGKKLFEGTAGCSQCHAGTYFTDMKKHDVGTRRSGDDGPDNNPSWDVNGWDTPSLIEVWRTAPYLHLGSAMTIEDAVTAHTKMTKSAELDKIVAYVKQIGPTRKVTTPIQPTADGGVDPTGGSSGSSGAGGASGEGGTSGTPDSSGTAGSSGSESSSSSSDSPGTAGTSGSISASSSDAEEQPKAGGCLCALTAHPSTPGALPLLAGLALLGLRAARRRR